MKRGKVLLLLSLMFITLNVSSCTKHDVEVKPIEVKPIHITIDINIKVDKALDDFFGDLDEMQAK